MAALGGDVPACVQLWQLWHAAIAAVGEGGMNSVHVLRRVDDIPEDEPPWQRPSQPYASPPRPGVRRALMSTSLPAALEDVLAQAAVLDCEQRWDDGTFPIAGKRLGLRMLTDKVEAAVTETLRGAGDHTPVRVRVACHVVTDDGVSADVDARHGHIRIDLNLRLGWLVRVWRAGLASAGGVVVLEVLDSGPGEFSALALEWTRSGHDVTPALRRVLLQHDGTTWTRRQEGIPHAAADAPWWSVRTGPARS